MCKRVQNLPDILGNPPGWLWILGRRSDAIDDVATAHCIHYSLILPM